MYNSRILKTILVGIIALNITNVYALDDTPQQDNNVVVNNTDNQNQEEQNQTTNENPNNQNEQNQEVTDEPIIKIKNGLIEEDGKKYYYENDKKVCGFKKVGDNLYFFSSKDMAATQGWKVAYGKVWYQNADGIVVRGLQLVEGKKYYFNETTGYQEIGFKQVGDNLYFFSSKDKAATQGWKMAYGNVWYQNADGIVVRGLQLVEGKRYYFNETTGYQEIGFKQVGEDLYFFSSKNKAATQGWKAAYGNVWYQNADGKVVRGLQIVEGKKYYFNLQTGYQEVGFKQVGNDLYYFSGIDKTATQGWKAAYGNLWYQDENGIVLKSGWHTINGKKYYVNDRYVVRGINLIDSKYYYFNSNNGELLKGWINNGIKIYYASEDGSLIKSHQTINNKEYYFNNNYELVKGLVRINNKTYYYNSSTGEKMYGSFCIAGNQYTLDSSTGEVIKVQYIPKYYSQKDSRWAYITYGRSNMGNTGCAPTSMAMAFTSILEKDVLPPHVADYLYYETNEYNKKDSGTSGMGIIYASERFNIAYERLNTKEQLVNALSQGKIVFAAMADGKFATKNWNHAILVYYIEGNKVNTISADPLNQLNNGLVPIDTIWREQSKDPDDTSGGAALYALSPRIQEITE